MSTTKTNTTPTVVSTSSHQKSRNSSSSSSSSTEPNAIRDTKKDTATAATTTSARNTNHNTTTNNTTTTTTASIPQVKDLQQQRLLELCSTFHIRVAVVGNVDAGKSTLIGTLCHGGQPDDGNGSNRLLVSKFPHELESGRTSTITSHFLAYANAQGQTVVPPKGNNHHHNNKHSKQSKPQQHSNHANSNATPHDNQNASNNTNNTASSTSTTTSTTTSTKYVERYLVQHAAPNLRTVSLLDLAGHEKYFKTTIAGLSRGMADYALVLINASHSQGLTHMTLHHLSLCQMCGIPIIIVLTKLDAAPPNVLHHVRQQIQQVLRGGGSSSNASTNRKYTPNASNNSTNTHNKQKKPFRIQRRADVDLVCDKTHALIPIIELSCVEPGHAGLEYLQYLLLKLPKRRHHETKIHNRPCEFLLEELFHVTGVGTVVSGFVNAGQTRKGDSLYLGPCKDGSFFKTTIKSIHVAQTPVDQVWAGHSACFALAVTKQQRKLFSRKGMVLQQPSSTVTSTTNNNPAVSSISTASPHWSALVLSLQQQGLTPPSLGFTAEICLAKGDAVTMVPKQTQTTLHILHLKQTCRLEDFVVTTTAGSRNANGTNTNGSAVPSTTVPPPTVLRPGQRATVVFSFLQGPQYVRPGMRVILREGHVRGIGMIQHVHFHHLPTEPLLSSISSVVQQQSQQRPSSQRQPTPAGS